jgi:rod shape-determining protein MreD
VRAAWAFLAIAIALALQTTLARFVIRGSVAIDLVLVIVVFVGLSAGPVTGLFAGTLGGLAQDALSSGIIGIAGLAKTVVGFFTGLVGTQFIVVRPIPRFVVFFVASILDAVVFIGLYVLLGLREFGSPYTGVMSQAAANAVLGVVLFQLHDLLPGAIERRRQGRGINMVKRLGD